MVICVDVGVLLVCGVLLDWNTFHKKRRWILSFVAIKENTICFDVGVC